jgi:hypothetical protein
MMLVVHLELDHGHGLAELRRELRVKGELRPEGELRIDGELDKGRGEDWGLALHSTEDKGYTKGSTKAIGLAKAHRIGCGILGGMRVVLRHMVKWLDEFDFFFAIVAIAGYAYFLIWVVRKAGG